MKVKMKEDYADRATEAVTPSSAENTDAGNSVTQRPEEIPYSDKHSEYQNISDDLTSQFIFYPFNTLSIKPFDIGAVRKVFRSVSLQRIEYIVEAISSCIDPDKRAQDLTVQDFWSLMFWERINSYKKTVYNVDVECSHPSHIAQVESGEVDRSTLSNNVPVKSMNDLQVNPINAAVVVEYVTRVKDTYNIHLYPTTMADVIEMEKIKADLTEGGNRAKYLKEKHQLSDVEELTWLSKLASNLSHIHGATLLQRIDYLTQNNLSPDLLEEIENFIKISDHGVSETLSVPCAHCKNIMEVEVSFDALSFFPRN